MSRQLINTVKKIHWLLCLLIGVLGALFIWLNFQTGREDFTILRYLFFIIVFIFILIGISLFPNNFKNKYLLLSVIFIFYMGYVNPKLNFFAQNKQLEQYYIYENVFLNPLLFFAVCFAYRLGGGRSSQCFKTGINAIILLFSGFLDLMWFTMNNVPYAVETVNIPHIKIVIGHEPSFMELCLFILFHLLFLIIINALPFAKWLKKISERKTSYA